MDKSTSIKTLVLMYFFTLIATYGGEKSGLVNNLESGKKQVIVTYGTSLTANGAWVNQFRAVLQNKFPGLPVVINSGGSGKWSRWGVNNLDDRVIKKKPDTLFMEFSINDSVARFNASVDIARANLESMIDSVLKANPKCEIILMTMTPGDLYPKGHRSRRENIEAHYQMYRSVAKERGLRLIDHYPNWKALQSSNPTRFKKYVPDTIHPTATGCSKVVTPVILDALGISEVEQKKSLEKPKAEYLVKADLDHADSHYAMGEKAVFSFTVMKDGKPLDKGTAHVTFWKNGTKTARKSIDLAKRNPFTLSETMDKPGFIDPTIDVNVDGKKVHSNNHRLIGAAFDPEKIRAGAGAPADLLDYWKGQFEKLNKEVPPNFIIKKAYESKNLVRYTVTCDNFGGTKTYAAITMPKGPGPFPMVFTVPPAGNFGYGFFKTHGMIHVTIPVFDRLFKAPNSYRDFNKPHYYYYKGTQKRDTYYYYKAIVGVMRMMNYAETNIKEWDGKNLVASGRSQGGGFALIMTALNPKIKGVTADIPALCDHKANQAGRRAGWPQVLSHPATASSFAEDAPYYDAANFASLITCPAIVSVGFIDTMCVPSSVYAAYNNLKGEKKLYDCPRYGHGWGSRTKEYDNAVKVFIKNHTSD